MGCCFFSRSRDIKYSKEIWKNIDADCAALSKAELMEKYPIGYEVPGTIYVPDVGERSVTFAVYGHFHDMLGLGYMSCLTFGLKKSPCNILLPSQVFSGSVSYRDTPLKTILNGIEFRDELDDVPRDYIQNLWRPYVSINPDGTYNRHQALETLFYFAESEVLDEYLLGPDELEGERYEFLKDRTNRLNIFDFQAGIDFWFTQTPAKEYGNWVVVDPEYPFAPDITAEGFSAGLNFGFCIGKTQV